MSEKKQIIGKEHEEGSDHNFMTYLIYFIKIFNSINSLKKRLLKNSK
jgi:hypothetical protein